MDMEGSLRDLIRCIYAQRYMLFSSSVPLPFTGEHPKRACHMLYNKPMERKLKEPYGARCERFKLRSKQSWSLDFEFSKQSNQSGSFRFCTCRQAPHALLQKSLKEVSFKNVRLIRKSRQIIHWIWMNRKTARRINIINLEGQMFEHTLENSSRKGFREFTFSLKSFQWKVSRRSRYLNFRFWSRFLWREIFVKRLSGDIFRNVRMWLVKVNNFILHKIMFRLEAIKANFVLKDNFCWLIEKLAVQPLDSLMTNLTGQQSSYDRKTTIDRLSDSLMLLIRICRSLC